APEDVRPAVDPVFAFGVRSEYDIDQRCLFAGVALLVSRLSHRLKNSKHSQVKRYERLRETGARPLASQLYQGRKRRYGGGRIRRRDPVRKGRRATQVRCRI